MTDTTSQNGSASRGAGGSRHGNGFRTLSTPVIILLLSLAAIAVYSNSLGAPFVFDDFENIQHPATVRMDRLDLDHLLKRPGGDLPPVP
jgi:hypothetical protein